VEKSKMEQRYDAVLGVIKDGFSVTEVARKFNVSRQTVHTWMARYERGGLEALEDRSHRPSVSPHQMDPMVEARVLELRRLHPHWGQITIAHRLAKEQVDPLPSPSSIYRALVRSGVLVPHAPRKKLVTYKRWERGRPMELWQMDVVGGVLTHDGTEAKLLTGIDDHSRFVVCCGVMARATLRPVCLHFAAAIERHGVPEEILTDNGKVFTNRYGHSDSETMFDRLCRENGITHLLTAPRSPTTTGKIERFHRTLRTEFLTGRTFASLQAAQEEVDAWVVDYNTKRPHQSLKMATPSERFARRKAVTQLAAVTTALDEDRSGDDWVARTVTVNGVVTVKGQAFSVGKSRSGRIVDVHVNEGVLEVWDGPELLKAVKRTTSGSIRKKRAEQHPKRGGTSSEVSSITRH
jgi:transposase InsO family protein